MEFAAAPPSNLSFPQTELSTLAYWRDPAIFPAGDAFRQSLIRNASMPVYQFYDGPPFATGLPHHGHILAGTIKDVVTRYAHQTGHSVERRFGWDCHGVPVENEINKKHQIKNRSDVLDSPSRGIAWYNDECRSIVQLYTREWETTMTRLGRWIDFKNDYKTMDLSFMESVWSVFKRLDSHGYVYRGVRVMPCSTALGTPMSKHEVGPETYRMAQDPVVVVSFPIVDDAHHSEFCIWTTTPWTLPSNVALCVSPKLAYVRVQDKTKNRSGRVFVLAEARLSELYKSKDEYAQIGPSFLGSTLVGARYVPCFDYFVARSANRYFVVFADDYVTADSGTGVVHLAPGFGEDDFRVCLANKLFVMGGADPIPCPVDDEGIFMADFPDLQGKHVKDAETNRFICDALKAKGRLLTQGSVTHSVPHCSRSQTPLIYRAVPSWFVRIEEEVEPGKGSLRDRMLKSNANVAWVPDFVGTRRFHEWLAQARDWNVSRNRFWGTPIPIWQNEDGTERLTVGSVAELETLTGKRFSNIHRQFIDDVVIVSPVSGKPLRRVPEVFDCWFESGSMPYAQSHHVLPATGPAPPPSGFPADFIAEGLDQTRGWFYTLMVLSNALFSVAPFKNVIVNGLVLAADGRKMSKSQRNFPPPEDVVNRHGADALRLYLMNSPVVRAEPLRFQEDGVQAVVREVFIPWLNAVRFFIQNAIRVGPALWDAGLAPTRAASARNLMDQWIQAECKDLVLYVRQEMGLYHLYNVMPRLVKFIDQLTNWFVRLNRNRLKGAEGPADAQDSLSVLFETLLVLCSLMAPFTPFFTEHVYQLLVPMGSKRRAFDSVHFSPIPSASDITEAETAVLRKVRNMQRAVQLGRLARGDMSMKKPVQTLVVVTDDLQLRADLVELQEYIAEELNAFEVVAAPDPSAWGKLSIVCENKVMGKRLKGGYDLAKAQIEQKEDPIQVLKALETHGKYVLEPSQVEIFPGEVAVTRQFLGDASKFGVGSQPDLMVCVDRAVTEALLDAGLAREFKSAVQKLRKSGGLVPEDKVLVYCEVLGDVSGASEQRLERVLFSSQDPKVVAALGLRVRPLQDMSRFAVVIARADEEELSEGLRVKLCLARPWVRAKDQRFEYLLNALGLERLMREEDALRFMVDGAEVALSRKDWEAVV